MLRGAFVFLKQKEAPKEKFPFGAFPSVGRAGTRPNAIYIRVTRTAGSDA